jgi:hypothetical protein
MKIGILGGFLAFKLATYIRVAPQGNIFRAKNAPDIHQDYPHDTLSNTGRSAWTIF